MKNLLLALAILGISCTGIPAFAEPGAVESTEDPGPCAPIKAACESAGFAAGQAKEGTGLYKDCIHPIMAGQQKSKSVKPLPSIDPNVVAACKAARPNYGSGKMHSKKK